MTRLHSLPLRTPVDPAIRSVGALQRRAPFLVLGCCCCRFADRSCTALPHCICVSSPRYLAQSSVAELHKAAWWLHRLRQHSFVLKLVLSSESERVLRSPVQNHGQATDPCPSSFLPCLLTILCIPLPAILPRPSPSFAETRPGITKHNVPLGASTTL